VGIVAVWLSVIAATQFISVTFLQLIIHLMGLQWIITPSTHSNCQPQQPVHGLGRFVSRVAGPVSHLLSRPQFCVAAFQSGRTSCDQAATEMKAGHRKKGTTINHLNVVSETTLPFTRQRTKINCFMHMVTCSFIVVIIHGRNLVFS